MRFLMLLFVMLGSSLTLAQTGRVLGSREVYRDEYVETVLRSKEPVTLQSLLKVPSVSHRPKC